MGTGSDSADMAEKVDHEGTDADYEQNAIDAVVRSWMLDDPQCQALALADAQVWATLHLARMTSFLATQ